LIRTPLSKERVFRTTGKIAVPEATVSIGNVMSSIPDHKAGNMKNILKLRNSSPGFVSSRCSEPRVGM